jgi:hypothetical protein
VESERSTIPAYHPARIARAFPRKRESVWAL